MTRSGFPSVERLVDSDLAQQAKNEFENETRNREAKLELAYTGDLTGAELVEKFARMKAETRQRLGVAA